MSAENLGSNTVSQGVDSDGDHAAESYKGDENRDGNQCRSNGVLRELKPNLIKEKTLHCDVCSAVNNLSLRWARKLFDLSTCVYEQRPCRSCLRKRGRRSPRLTILLTIHLAGINICLTTESAIWVIKEPDETRFVSARLRALVANRSVIGELGGAGSISGFQEVRIEL